MTFATELMNIAMIITFIALALGQILSMVRLVIGPTSGDRILALDTMVINAIGLVILIGIYQGVQIYFEVSLLIAMLGFVSTVALARFLLRGDFIECLLRSSSPTPSPFSSSPGPSSSLPLSSSCCISTTL